MAVKLSVIGVVGSIIFCVFILLFLFFLCCLFTKVFQLILCLSDFNSSVDDILILFPIFSGLFELSMIFLQLGKKVKIPKQQSEKYVFVSNSLTNRALYLVLLVKFFWAFAQYWNK